MKNAGEFIGKTVLSLSGERLGEINNLTFDKYFKHLKNLCIFDDEQDEFMLPINSIYYHGENAVLVKINIRPPVKNTYLSPLTIKAYDLYGKLLGMVCDISFESDGKTTAFLVLEDGQKLSCKNISSHGKDAIFFDFSDKPKRFIKRKINALNSPKIPEKTENKEQQTESLEKPPLNFPPVKKDLPPKLPESFVIGAKLLIGRKVKSNISLKDGKVFIRQGTIITNETINLALKYGKLFELTVNSLGNIRK